MVLGSTEPVTEMSARNLPGRVKGGRRVRLTTLPPSVRRLSIENVGASTGIALPYLLPLQLIYGVMNTEIMMQDVCGIFLDNILSLTL
jgi:hypothetical protein